MKTLPMIGRVFLCRKLSGFTHGSDSALSSFILSSLLSSLVSSLSPFSSLSPSLCSLSLSLTYPLTPCSSCKRCYFLAIFPVFLPDILSARLLPLWGVCPFSLVVHSTFLDYFSSALYPISCYIRLSHSCIWVCSRSLLRLLLQGKRLFLIFW